MYTLSLICFCSRGFNWLSGSSNARLIENSLMLLTLWWPRHKAIHFSWLGSELLVCCLAHRFSFAPGFCKLFGAQGSPSSGCESGSLLNLLSPRFLVHQMQTAQKFNTKTLNNKNHNRRILVLNGVKVLIDTQKKK